MFLVAVVCLIVVFTAASHGVKVRDKPKTPRPPPPTAHPKDGARCVHCPYGSLKRSADTQGRPLYSPVYVQTEDSPMVLIRGKSGVASVYVCTLCHNVSLFYEKVA